MRIALAGELLRRGYAVDFVLCQVRGDLLPMVPSGVRIVDLAASRTLASIKPLARYFRETPPDAMFSSLGPQNMAAIAARGLARSSTWLGVMQHNALSTQARSGISIQQRLVPLGYRLMLSRADRVLAVSAGVADDLATATGYPRTRVGVLYNPACPENVESIIADRPDHPFFESGDPVLVGVGRLVGQKGWDTLLHAVAIASQQRPVRLLIAGVGPDHDALAALARSLGIADRVALLGYQAAPLAWVAASDLFVMSSRYEGFGNVLVEALAAGTPIVSTDCDFGPSEILDEGTYGRLVPVDDPAALADAIVAALDDPRDPERLRERARDFSITRVTDRYLAEAFGASHQPVAPS